MRRFARISTREITGVDAEFLWFDYVPSMDAYVAGKVDAVCMTTGDALVGAWYRFSEWHVG